MAGIFILWSCVQNAVGIRVVFFEWLGWLLILFLQRVFLVDALSRSEYDLDLDHDC